MAKNNPMSGGPDFVELLKNALEGKVDGFVRPPATGGLQISLRFREDRLILLNQLSERSGWNRTQVVDALIDKGLFALFERLPSGLADEIIQNTVEAIFKS